METKVGRIHAERLRVKLGFEGLFYVDSVGRSGGLALLWRKNNTARLMSFSRNHVDVEVNMIGLGVWRMTGFYGFPERGRRNASWDLLRSLAGRSSLLWVVIGDFNDLLFQSEKRGGIPHPDNLLRGFGEAVEDCGLAQLPMRGYQFTWERGKGTTDWMEERLYKVLAGVEWTSFLPGANVTNILTRNSDHSALFLGVKDERRPYQRLRRSFKFEMAWVHDEGCRKQVEEAWQDETNQLGGDHLHKFGKKIKKLRCDQLHLRGRLDPQSLREYQRLETELCQLEAQEDAFWRQRAKQHWVRNADANTKFFHRYASARKKKNTLSRLKNAFDVWVEGDDLNAVVLDYFNDIFASNHSSISMDGFAASITPRVTHDQNDSLLRPFEPDEVKAALFSMFRDKVPGPDSMNPGFYQHYWDVVGSDVSSFVIKCLNECTLLEGLNDTNVVLIPKKASPEKVSDLRPIALCNVVYKIMPKMVANRMKPLLGDVISDSQSAFIPNRLITDNILVAAESYDAGGGSYQAVPNHKSSVCFSRNTSDADSHDVMAVLDVIQAPNFGKYLGLPSFIGREKKAVFSYIEDRIKHRIGSWSKRMISQAGKEVLLKSVAQSMPTFSMSVFLLPDSVCMSIERAMNRYWWGSGNDRGIHWKAWDCLCIPKKYGGLGFKDLKAFNLAMLGKQAWCFLTRPHSLVARVYKARYFPKTSFIDATLGNCPSFCWRSIMAAHGIVYTGLRRRVGNGEATLIWGHPWLPDDPTSMMHSPMPHQLSGSLVSGLIDPVSGTWDQSILQDIFLPSDVDRILRVPVSPQYEDSWFWLGDPKGCYTVKEGYMRVIGNFEHTPVTFDNWLHLWKVKCLAKWKTFIWRALTNSLPTTTNLIIKRVEIDPSCPMCGVLHENTMHSLVLCDYSRLVWNESSLHVTSMSGNDFGVWFSNVIAMLTEDKIIYAVELLYHIWRARNSAVWEACLPRPSRVWQSARAATAAWKEVHVSPQP
ncbi:uncharacterized protein LOC116001121 [Ipomoea triloba]|uniref:uncharacterized protein LOC116001121 n=1 Tax=Ipomoea triloba TaxID=35885 RepID=UPI00125D1DB8|nr:uncharacterized protein LOC116001121 [Ipomoea triloba]